MLEEAAEQRPLIAPLSSLDLLRAEYEGGSTSFVKKIDWLQKECGFRGIRRTRGDGDCFYRCQSSLMLFWSVNGYVPPSPGVLVH